jgi:hypothetical protein
MTLSISRRLASAILAAGVAAALGSASSTASSQAAAESTYVYAEPAVLADPAVRPDHPRRRRKRCGIRTEMERLGSAVRLRKRHGAHRALPAELCDWRCNSPTGRSRAVTPADVCATPHVRLLPSPLPLRQLRHLLPAQILGRIAHHGCPQPPTNGAADGAQKRHPRRRSYLPMSSAQTAGQRRWNSCIRATQRWSPSTVTRTPRARR